MAHAKGSKTRNIPLHPDIAQALKVLVWPSQGRLFPDLTPQSLSQRGSRYLKSVGSVSTMHKLRHYAATTYWAAKAIREQYLKNPGPLVQA